MHEVLRTAFAEGWDIAPLPVLLRLAAALLGGAVVAWIYLRTQQNGTSGASLATTLVLLALLIAMTTQVIGDNVARAFSLVGALSIVRFRTVVRDTRDTAFVIFAVVIGMAAGGQNLWVGILGLILGGIAAFVLARTPGLASDPRVFLLQVRVGLGSNLEQELASTLRNHVREVSLVSSATAKQGISLETCYELKLHPKASVEDLVRLLNRIEGVQDVRLTRRGFDDV